MENMQDKRSFTKSALREENSVALVMDIAEKDFSFIFPVAEIFRGLISVY